MKRRKQILVRRKVPDLVRGIKLVRREKKKYGINVDGSFRWFLDENHWSDKPVLMTYSEAKFLKWKLDKKYYGRFIIKPIK